MRIPTRLIIGDLRQHIYILTEWKNMAWKIIQNAIRHFRCRFLLSLLSFARARTRTHALLPSLLHTYTHARARTLNLIFAIQPSEINSKQFGKLKYKEKSALHIIWRIWKKVRLERPHFSHVAGQYKNSNTLKR